MRFQIQTLDIVRRKESCVLFLDSIQTEFLEVVNISMEFSKQSRTLEGGGLVMELDARGIRSDEGAVKYLSVLKSGGLRSR